MSKKFKVLFVSHLFYPAHGGVETHLYRLTRGLSKTKYDIQVLTTDALSTEAFFLGDSRRIEKKDEIIDGVRIERIGFRTFGRKILNLMRAAACRLKYPGNEWFRIISYGPRNSQFFKKIVQYRPDIIFAAPLPMATVYYSYKAARKLKVPLIVNPAYHIHDPCSFYNPTFFKIMREADLVAVHSHIEKDYLHKHAGVLPKKIKIFPPLPFEDSDFSEQNRILSTAAIKQKYGIGQSSIVLFMGQHGRHKNIPRIFRAMQIIWENNIDAALVIAGGVTQFTPELKNLAAEIPLGRDRIHFIDNFEPAAKPEIFHMADVFISLSEFESFGIVFAEAMKHGLPVVASRENTASSMVDEFRTGLMVDPQCPEDVGAALMELLLDQEVRKIYGNNGRIKVLADYHPRKILDSWEAVFERLLNRSEPQE